MKRINAILKPLIGVKNFYKKFRLLFRDRNFFALRPTQEEEYSAAGADKHDADAVGIERGIKLAADASLSEQGKDGIFWLLWAAVMIW